MPPLRPRSSIARVRPPCHRPLRNRRRRRRWHQPAGHRCAIRRHFRRVAKRQHHLPVDRTRSRSGCAGVPFITGSSDDRWPASWGRWILRAPGGRSSRELRIRQASIRCGRYAISAAHRSDVEVLAIDPWSARTPARESLRRPPDLPGRRRGPPESALGRTRVQHVRWRRREPGVEDRGSAARACGPELLASTKSSGGQSRDRPLDVAAAQETFLAPAFATAGLDDDTERRAAAGGAGSRRPSARRSVRSSTVSVSCSGTTIRIRQSSGPSTARRLRPRARLHAERASWRAGCRMPGSAEGRSIYDLLGAEFSIVSFGVHQHRSWRQPLAGASR